MIKYDINLILYIILIFIIINPVQGDEKESSMNIEIKQTIEVILDHEGNYNTTIKADFINHGPKEDIFHFILD